VVVLRVGVPPWIDGEGAEALGGGMARLVDVRRPRLVHLTYLRGAAPEVAGASLQLGPGDLRSRLSLVFFSPHEVEADLRMIGRADAGTLLLACQVVPGAMRVRALEAALTQAPTSTLSGPSPLAAQLRLKLGQGLTTVVLSSPSGGAAKLSDVAVVARH
jgi:hypothetical protein